MPIPEENEKQQEEKESGKHRRGKSSNGANHRSEGSKVPTHALKASRGFSRLVVAVDVHTSVTHS